MADQEARDELRRLLDAAVGRLLAAGLAWDEVAHVIRKRLNPTLPLDVPPGKPERVSWIPQQVEPVVVPRDGRAVLLEHDVDYVLVPPPARAPVPEPSAGSDSAGPGRPVDGYREEVLRGPAEAVDPREGVDVVTVGAVVEAARADEPGEPPVGSVVTDTRSRVCWRDEAGWHRSGVEEPMTWAQVVQAVGPDPQNPRQPQPMPGTPTIISSPPQRVAGPTVLRPARRMELPVQRPMLGPDGQPMVDAAGHALVGPTGQPLLRTEIETVQIHEIVPADGRP